MVFHRTHPLLGAVAVTPTQLSAGVARNVTPPEARAMLDIRTTPAYEHAEVVAMIRDTVEARVEIYSDRLVPAETPPDSRLLPAVMAACRGARPFGLLPGNSPILCVDMATTLVSGVFARVSAIFSRVSGILGRFSDPLSDLALSFRIGIFCKFRYTTRCHPDLRVPAG